MKEKLQIETEKKGGQKEYIAAAAAVDSANKKMNGKK